MGKVYFLHDAANKSIKIGWTAGDPLKRLYHCQIGNPNTLKLIGFVEGERVQEQEWHDRFGFYHLRGEWFREVENLMEAIAEYSIMPAEQSTYDENWHPLRKYRDKHKISQAKLASLIGVQDAAVCKWEKGKVSVNKVLEVERVTGIPRYILRPDIYPVPDKPPVEAA